MELLVDGLSPHTKKAFQDENGDYKEIAEWEGVTSSADGDVHEIEWQDSTISVECMNGTFDSHYLPRTLKRLNLEKVKCQCTLNFAALPDYLMSFRIAECSFVGSVDLGVFPASSVDIEIRGSTWNDSPARFTGTVDLTRLPPDLEILSLRYTLLSGTIDLEHLNTKLEWLLLTYSAFSGSVTFNNLPATLSRLDLNNNALSGEIDLYGVPDTLEEINIAGNYFSGVLDLTKVPETLDVTHKDLFGSKNVESSLTIIERK